MQNFKENNKKKVPKSLPKQRDSTGRSVLQNLSKNSVEEKCTENEWKNMSFSFNSLSTDTLALEVILCLTTTPVFSRSRLS